jgi:hypothetical protein
VPKERIVATKSLFQYTKAAPSKDNAAADIKRAIEANDMDKAKKLAVDYNTRYAKSFKPWTDKYSAYKDEADLMKFYQKGKITSESISRWVGIIKKERAGQ